MSDKTAVGQVALVGGGRYDQPYNVLVDEHASHLGKKRGRGSLYILVEVTGPASGRDLIADRMTQVMRQAYHSWKGSVTAGLQQAIRRANDLLLEENRHSLPGERRTAGASCVLLRDDDLFIAQAGPAAICLARAGRVTRFPDTSPWLDGTPLEEADAAPLGERHDVHIDLFHSAVSEGDTFLLVDSELVRSVPAAIWPDVLSKTPVDGVIEGLLTTTRGRDLSALAVRLGEEAVQKAPARPKARPREEQIRAAQPQPVVRSREEPIEKAQPQPVARPREETVARVRPKPVVVAEAPAVPADQAEPAWEQLTAGLAQVRIGERLQMAVRAGVAALAGLAIGFLSILKRMLPGRTEPQPSPATRSITVTSTESKSRGRPRERRAVETQSAPIQKLLLGVAIAIPLIVAVIVLVTWFQRGQVQRVETQALWQQANALWQQAQTAGDSNAARTYLAEAERSLNQVLERQPDHAQATDLQKKIQARMDVVNQVKRITWTGELNSYPANADLSRVVVQGAHIFVLDRQNDQVYHHKLDEQLQKALVPDSRDTVLVRKGDQIGAGVVGDLVDMEWMPSGPNRQKASLVILESGGTLLDYDPTTGQLVPLRVAASEMWQFPKLVGSHSGRFYLLDSTANKIWRYDPTPDGYSTPPENWLQVPVDLAGVTDMAIGDSIYLLYADGTTAKFTQGQPDSFDISTWDIPPRTPTAIFGRPSEETRWIYIADQGNSRIVQSAPEGTFEQQFRLADAQAAENGDILAGAKDLFVDEIVGHAYVLSRQGLYLLILPMSD